MRILTKQYLKCYMSSVCYIRQWSIFTDDYPYDIPWVPRHQAASAMMGATFAAAASPLPALAARVEEEDEGFDLRILAVPRRRGWRV